MSVTVTHRGTAAVEPLEMSRLAVVIVRAGVLPVGAAEAAAEAGGRVLVLGSGTAEAAAELGAPRAWHAETVDAAPAGLSQALVPLLEQVRLLVFPASPDGRDFAPRLAAALGRPLLAYASSASLDDEGVRASLSRLDGRLEIDVRCAEPAVVTLMPGVRSPLPPSNGEVFELVLDVQPGVDAERLAVLEPDPATMDLAESTRVVGGGAGLVAREADDTTARETFDLLKAIAARLGASAGATRVITDAGWMHHDRQIGTTGVTISPDLYLAMGVAGASQHTGGLGAPRHVVSVNTDPSCPMTAMADLGLVTDARALLTELAERLGVSGA
ncbi:MAG: Electron transfer flavoprotein alpha subunit [Frankiales bacterium]|nr:Electron transfer flavoprotein alpha subunit [Frankiales bacterium]